VDCFGFASQGREGEKKKEPGGATTALFGEILASNFGRAVGKQLHLKN